MTKNPSSPVLLSRRGFLNVAALGVASAAVSACTTVSSQPPIDYGPPPAPEPEMMDYDTIYGPLSDGGYEIPAVPWRKIPSQFLRQYVADPTGEKPGTVVVDTSGHFLYVVQPGGQALRYGVGVGRAGMEWSGTANVAYKRQWPSWTPTQNMIARNPETYKKWAGGMAGGSNNPLGARALYLFEGGKDTLYRIHGTNEPWSIGKSMSSGCIRMMNQDIIDLYRRVPDGSKVVVMPVSGGPGV